MGFLDLHQLSSGVIQLSRGKSRKPHVKLLGPGRGPRKGDMTEEAFTNPTLSQAKSSPHSTQKCSSPSPSPHPHAAWYNLTCASQCCWFASHHKCDMKCLWHSESAQGPLHWLWQGIGLHCQSFCHEINPLNHFDLLPGTP